MNRRRGFTLVELLIVIAVMGILSSMMMVSSSESVTTAKANNIISNLRNFSMAAMAYYTDHVEEVGKAPTTYEITLAKVTPYMHNEGSVPDKDNYIVTNNDGVWWAGCNLQGIADDAKIREKLENRAGSANLKGSSDKNTTPAPTNGSYPEYTTSYNCVWLLIRSSQRPSSSGSGS